MQVFRVACEVMYHISVASPACLKQDYVPGLHDLSAHGLGDSAQSVQSCLGHDEMPHVPDQLRDMRDASSLCSKLTMPSLQRACMQSYRSGQLT